MDLQNNKSPDIAFLIGMGRSGTTLLTNILNSNPEVIATPENEFLLFTYQSFLKADFKKEKTVRKFIDIFGLNFNKVISIWQPNIKNLQKDISLLPIKTFPYICKSVYLNYPFIKDKIKIKCIVDKNPSYSLHIDKIANIYPDAKYIVITRNFKDNILSRKKYAQNKNSIYDLAVAWNFYYSKIFKSLHKNNLNYHLIKYEDLVTDTHTTLLNLCKYLNIDYTEDMLHFQQLSKQMKAHARKNTSSEIAERIEKMHSNLDNDINTSRVKAYEKELTTEEIKILNYICGQQGAKLGYEKSHDSSKIKINRLFKYSISFFKIRIYHVWISLYYKLPVWLRVSFLNKKQDIIS